MAIEYSTEAEELMKLLDNYINAKIHKAFCVHAAGDPNPIADELIQDARMRLRKCVGNLLGDR